MDETDREEARVGRRSTDVAVALLQQQGAQILSTLAEIKGMMIAHNGDDDRRFSMTDVAIQDVHARCASNERDLGWVMAICKWVLTPATVLALIGVIWRMSK